MSSSHTDGSSTLDLATSLQQGYWCWMGLGESFDSWYISESFRFTGKRSASYTSFILSAAHPGEGGKEDEELCFLAYKNILSWTIVCTVPCEWEVSLLPLKMQRSVLGFPANHFTWMNMHTVNRSSWKCYPTSKWPSVKLRLLSAEVTLENGDLGSSVT